MFNYILCKIGCFIALHVPLRTAYKIAIFISDVRYIFAREDRLATRENLETIFPQKTEMEIRRIRLIMFRNFAKYLVDFFRFSELDKESIKRNTKVENLHYVDEALAKGKGVITLTAHMGNWELGGVIMALLGYPLWAVVLPHKHKKEDNFFNYQRESKGVKIIPLGRAVRACLNLLKENKVIALAGDRDFTQLGAVVDFFGKPTYFPQGPAALALKTGAAIVPGFTLRNKDDSCTLWFEKPIEFTSTGDKNEDLLVLIKKCRDIIEGYIQKYPDQWFMFRRFWIQ